MALLRIVNITLYFFILYVLYERFIDSDFFSRMGGAEIAFLLLLAAGGCWAAFIVYGLTVGAAWGFSHAVWLNGVVILVLLFRLAMAALSGELLIQDFVVKDVSALVIIVLLLYFCIAYMRRKKGSLH